MISSADDVRWSSIAHAAAAANPLAPWPLLWQLAV
jgi:hypothetical protein